MQFFHNKWLRILTFIALLSVFFIVIEDLLTPNWNNPIIYENHGFCIEEIGRMSCNADVFFVGASHMEFSVSPMKLYEDYGIVTYNVSTNGQPIEVTNFLTHYIFEKGQKPQIIALDVSSLFLKSGDAGIRYVSDNVGISKYKLQMINNFINNPDSQGSNYLDLEAQMKDVLSFVVPFYKYHTRWDELGYSDFFSNKMPDYFLQGFYASTSIGASGVAVEDVDTIAMQVIEKQSTEKRIIANNDIGGNEAVYAADETYVDTVLDYNIKILKEIADTCKEHDCQLLLLKNPVNSAAGIYPSTWTTMRHDSVQKVATDLGVDFLDLNFVDLGIDWKHDTRDGGCHLNYRGALKVTEYVGTVLCDKYGVLPKKEDEYDKKIEMYDKYTDLVGIEVSYNFEDYIKNILKSNHRFIVYISAKDDMRGGLSSSDIDSLKSLGLKTDFNQMGFRDSFIAVIDNEGVVYEQVSGRKQQYSLLVDGKEVVIQSGGFLDGNTSSICVDGREESLNGRGINIVVVDEESGLIIDKAVCDTCDANHEVIHCGDEMLLVEYQNFLLGKKW